jgi:hypothetical protein
VDSQAGRRRFDSGRPLQRSSGVTAQAVTPDASANFSDWQSSLDASPRPLHGRILAERCSQTVSPRSSPPLTARRWPGRPDSSVATWMLAGARIPCPRALGAAPRPTPASRTSNPSTRRGHPNAPGMSRKRGRLKVARARSPVAGRRRRRPTLVRDGRATACRSADRGFRREPRHARRQESPLRRCKREHHQQPQGRQQHAGPACHGYSSYPDGSIFPRYDPQTGQQFARNVTPRSWRCRVRRPGTTPTYGGHGRDPPGWAPAFQRSSPDAAAPRDRASRRAPPRPLPAAAGGWPAPPRPGGGPTPGSPATRPTRSRAGSPGVGSS